MKKVILVLILLNFVLLSFGLKLPQGNPQEIFMSDESIKELKDLQKEFSGQEIVFISNLKNEDKEGLTDFAEFSSLAPILPNSGVMKVPELDDPQRYKFFSAIEQQFPHVKISGESYTNAHLAGMSIRIQNRLFPIVFGLIFLGLLFLTRNLQVGLYLFLSSLLGVGVGLNVISFFYGHSTILTTLTPLICFVLTLGVQLHVVYGMSYFKNLNVFFQHKLRPLLIMMITTLVGLLGLVVSDLEGIRQLAITASLGLAVTWGILLLLINLFPPKSELKAPAFINISLRIPKERPWIGCLILSILFCGGVIGLMRMPVLVEAIDFFPKGHQVQEGLRQIEKDFGGIPQFELVIKRKDGKDFTYADKLLIETYEENLSKTFPDTKFLSLNILVKLANEKYLGLKTLPDNIYAYNALSSKVPEMLVKFHATEKAYRISYVSTTMTPDMRKDTKQKLEETFEKLDPSYKIKTSGLTHLLLESQSMLVTSLVKSLLLSFSIIVLVFAIFSRVAKDVLIFAALNFGSILGGIFLMWISGMSLNVSSVMTVSISMGLVVDSTVHLLYADRSKEGPEALFLSTLTPIVLTHVLLFFAFLSLTFEAFIPIRDFGLGLTMLLFTGLLCDLYILPMIIKLKSS